MSVSMSNSGEEVIKRELLSSTSSSLSLSSFRLSEVSSWVSRHKCQVVALQFPDDLLKYALAVSSWLTSTLTSCTVCVLGDTSYSDCCVDVVAAQHLAADAVVHFTSARNQACLTPTVKGVRVKHVCIQHGHWQEEHKLQLIEKLDSLKNKKQGSVFLFYDLGLDGVVQSLELDRSHLVVAEPNFEPDDEDESEKKKTRVVVGGRLLPRLPVSSDTLVYIGCDEEDERMSTLLTLSFPNVQSLLHITLANGDVQGLKVSDLRRSTTRALMKRIYLIERIKEAKRIGLLVNTLAAAKYNEMVNQALKLIKKSCRRGYVFLVGKPNVAKMANFPEIDVFVQIACPLTSLFSDHDRSYLRPVVTPFELELALNNSRRDYNALVQGLVLDFKEVLPNATLWSPIEIDREGTDVSLISGRVRNTEQEHKAHQCLDDDDQGRKEVIEQDRSISTTLGSVDFLHSRSWRGLEPKLGETEVSKAVKGRSGIAMGYEDEGT